MGGVAMMEKAKAYLASANQNKTSEEVSALMVKLDALSDTVKRKDEQISDLLERLDESTKKRGRPRKED
jgi:ABC-type transporter Mla subunit MlaD